MAELGAYDLELMEADSGSVDLFGLDEFGVPAGMNQLWGAVIGGGLGTGTAIAVRALSGEPVAGKFDWKKYSEGVGFAVAAGASGLMMAFPGTRAAGWAGMAVAFMTNGLRQLEKMFVETTPAAFGAATIEPLNGVVMESLSPGSRDVGLGIPSAGYVPEAYGTIPGVYGTPVAGTQIGNAPPVDLMAPQNLPANSYQVSLMGGPQMSGLGAHYGATLFGGE
jgi:hypothetical protein